MGVTPCPLDTSIPVWTFMRAGHDYGCTCPANRNAGMKHTDMCGMTPIYRSLCMKESPAMIGLEIQSARLGGRARWVHG